MTVSLDPYTERYHLFTAPSHSRTWVLYELAQEVRDGADMGRSAEAIHDTRSYILDSWPPDTIHRPRWPALGLTCDSTMPCTIPAATILTAVASCAFAALVSHGRLKPQANKTPYMVIFSRKTRAFMMLK